MSVPKDSLHPHIRELPQFETEESDLDRYIGQRVRFVSPECPAEEDTFTVIGTQYDWKGDLCLRVVGDEDIRMFGRCAHLEELCVVG